jgi:CRP-like cAMP-binding protein
MPTNQSANLLQNVYLFKDLSANELAEISEFSKLETFNSGDEIFSEGDTAHSLYVIKYGTVKIMHSSRGESTEVATLGTGSHFGEMAFVDGEKRSATVMATERTDIVRIDFAELRGLLEKNPVIAMKIYKAFSHFLCGRLRLTTNDLSFAREKNLRHF